MKKSLFVILTAYSKKPGTIMMSESFSTKEDAIKEARSVFDAMVEQYSPPISTFDKTEEPMGSLIWPNGDFMKATGDFMALTVRELEEESL